MSADPAEFLCCQIENMCIIELRLIIMFGVSIYSDCSILGDFLDPKICLLNFERRVFHEVSNLYQ